jgi:hypothetical protein
MNTLEDGSGTDLTSVFTVYKISYGDVVKMTITNQSASDGWITMLQLWGSPRIEQGTSDITYPINVLGQSRELSIDSKWQQRLFKAKTIVNLYGPQIAAVRQFPVITFDTRPEALVPDLFDVVNVSVVKLGVTATDFNVGGIEIETTNETCQAFTVKFYLEPHLTN